MAASMSPGTADKRWKRGTNPLALVSMARGTADPKARRIAFACFFFERCRAISTARLWASLPLHLRPIDVIVSDGPVWRSNLGGGFALRCFQRLSLPDAATRRCPWRDNRRTGGRSDTVLSY